jgi:hypothetical protein
MVSIDRPAPAELDVSPFRRVLVTDFIAGGSADIDVNVETVRLLRSQLRARTSLKVIETDLPIAPLFGRDGCSVLLRNEKAVEACAEIFGQAALWRQLGNEYEQPLIISGTIFFSAYPHAASLAPTFVFIDGRSGEVLHSERLQERVSSPSSRRAALSWYFELMDRILPAFLRTVGDQSAHGTRALLR